MAISGKILIEIPEWFTYSYRLEHFLGFNYNIWISDIQFRFSAIIFNLSLYFISFITDIVHLPLETWYIVSFFISNGEIWYNFTKLYISSFQHKVDCGQFYICDKWNEKYVNRNNSVAFQHLPLSNFISYLIQNNRKI